MHHCHRFAPQAVSRREMLSRAAGGFGAAALAGLLADRSFGASPATTAHGPGIGPGGTLAALHRPPRATSVIFLYMDGGPSQVDTFDPKPLLDKEHGQPIKLKVPPTQFNNVGAVLRSPWPFRQHGESGIPVSALFPGIAAQVDELAVVRSMVSNFSEHTNGNYFLHTGSGQQGRPSMGAWVTYGLGSENAALPGFIVLNGGLIPPGGLDNFNSGFLPASYQGSIFKAGHLPVANLQRSEPTAELQAKKRALLEKLDAATVERAGGGDALESAVANYELAFRMQDAVPAAMDLAQETAATLRRYGLEHEFAPTKAMASVCLAARRLVERGVRFIEVTCPGVGHDRWDQHGNLVDGHQKNALAVDQPIAALLGDLKERGLLETTLVIWGGEFGRTPMAQGSDGRDHNPFGFTMWLAGGGIRGGTIYGATDEYGYFAVEKRTEIHDLHATMLHLLGVEHTGLTYRFGGRDMRLTDVHGEIIHGILA